MASPIRQSSGGGIFCLPITCGMGFPSRTASLQAVDPNHPSPAPTTVLVSHESQVGGKRGQGSSQNSLPQTSAGAEAGHTAASRSLPSVPSCLLRNQVLAWLVGGLFLTSKTLKISQNGFLSSMERSCWLGEQQLV